MAQVDMPEKKQARDYNDIPEPMFSYDMKAESKPKSGFSKWFDDIWTSLNEEIIKPTLMNLLRDVIVRGADKAIFHDEVRGNGSYRSYNNQYVSNYNYNPNSAYQNRFNSNDRYVQTAIQPQAAEDWRGFRFPSKSSAEAFADDIKNKIYNTGRCSVNWYSARYGEPCDWALGSYGWTNFNGYSIRRVMDGKMILDKSSGKMIPAPFVLIPPPEIYLGD